MVHPARYQLETIVFRADNRANMFPVGSLHRLTLGRMIAGMSSAEVELLKSRVRTQVSVDASESITCSARANAIKGIVVSRGH